VSLSGRRQTQFHETEAFKLLLGCGLAAITVLVLCKVCRRDKDWVDDVPVDEKVDDEGKQASLWALPASLCWGGQQCWLSLPLSGLLVLGDEIRIECNVVVVVLIRACSGRQLDGGAGISRGERRR